MTPRSMSKFAIFTEIKCDILGIMNAFSRLPTAQIMHFDLLSLTM